MFPVVGSFTGVLQMVVRECEPLDAGAAALEGGLHVRLYDGRRCGGGGFSPWSCGWCGAGRWGILVVAWHLPHRDVEA